MAIAIVRNCLSRSSKSPANPLRILTITGEKSFLSPFFSGYSSFQQRNSVKNRRRKDFLRPLKNRTVWTDFELWCYSRHRKLLAIKRFHRFCRHSHNFSFHRCHQIVAFVESKSEVQQFRGFFTLTEKPLPCFVGFRKINQKAKDFMIYKMWKNYCYKLSKTCTSYKIMKNFNISQWCGPLQTNTWICERFFTISFSYSLNSSHKVDVCEIYYCWRQK